MDIPKAILMARPGAKWNMTGDTLESLTMMDGSERPTMEELQPFWDAHVKRRAQCQDAKAAILKITDSLSIGVRIQMMTIVDAVNASLDRVDAQTAKEITETVVLPAELESVRKSIVTALA